MTTNYDLLQFLDYNFYIFWPSFWYIVPTTYYSQITNNANHKTYLLNYNYYFFIRNPYLSKVYGGNWFRTNFQDLFSYKGAQKLEWFEVLEGNDCSPVPATVNAGRPPRDICLEAAVDERRCICINTGRGSTETGYEPICGNCRDPCQLKFTPDVVPSYLQRLAVEDLEEDDKDRKNKKKK